MQLPAGALPSQTARGKIKNQTVSYSRADRYLVAGGTTFSKYIQQYSAGPLVAGKNENVVRTHGSLGLKPFWSIPHDATVEFLRRYATAVTSGERLCIDEKISYPSFNFFMDMDMKFSDMSLLQPEVVHVDGQDIVTYGWVKLVRDYATAVCRTLASFYPSLHEDMPKPQDFPSSVRDERCDPVTGKWLGALLAATPYANLISVGPFKIDVAKGIWKVGLHLNSLCPIVLDQPRALLICKACVEALEHNFGPRDLAAGENAWDSVVDTKVYGPPASNSRKAGPSGGIRLLGSHKTVKCEACKDGEGKSECEECDRRGKKLVASIYRPEWVLDKDGRDVTALAYLIDPAELHQAVLASSIRSRDVDITPGFVPPSGYSLENNTTVKKRTSAGPELVHGPFCAKKQAYAPNTEEAALVLQSIRSLHPKYEKVLLDANGCKRLGVQKYMARIRGPHEHFCMIADREHSDNVFFWITPKGIVQRCFSCKNKSSDNKPIMRALCDLLFGDVKIPRTIVFAPEPVMFDAGSSSDSGGDTPPPHDREEEPYSQESLAEQDELLRILRIRGEEIWGQAASQEENDHNRRNNVRKLWSAYGRGGKQPERKRSKSQHQANNSEHGSRSDNILWSRTLQIP